MNVTKCNNVTVGSRKFQLPLWIASCSVHGSPRPAATLTLTWPRTFIILHFATHTHDVPAFSSPAFLHSCDLVPRFPVLRFPVPRFQRPRRLAAHVSVRVSVISEPIPISTLVYMLLIAIFSSPSPTRIDCGWHILNEVVFITTSMLLLLNCLN